MTTTTVNEADIRRYEEVCAQIENLSLQITAAQAEFDAYRATHPPLTITQLGPVVHADVRRDELETKLGLLLRTRVDLLPEYAQLRFSLGLSR